MITKQLSVFIENKTGNLIDLTQSLGEAGINMSAFSLAETSDFGILRAITSEPERALEVLKAKRFAASLTDVVCLLAPNKPGALAEILKQFAEKNIYIDYMYAFSDGDAAKIVIKPDKLKECMEVLMQIKN
ncbi:MAG: amino acid-binding protein [Prevotellaceae bacterium]|jgi:hypothetical protein|nr:amino acid-binding protein [Prevotellaceae bacterium]